MLIISGEGERRSQSETSLRQSSVTKNANLGGNDLAKYSESRMQSQVYSNFAEAHPVFCKVRFHSFASSFLAIDSVSKVLYFFDLHAESVIFRLVFHIFEIVQPVFVPANMLYPVAVVDTDAHEPVRLVIGAVDV